MLKKLSSLFLNSSTYLVGLSLGFSFFIANKASAYPNFIGHGYNSCITCHYNPFGNGPINDYGRGVSATAIGSRGFYNDNKPEDLISQESGFFFKSPTSNTFRPSAAYRGLLLKRNYGEKTETSEYIHMQADLNLVAKFGSNDKFITSVSFGYAPIPRSIQNTPAGDKIDKFRTREHYIGFRPTANLGFYAGLMDKPFGIRVVEHVAYSRITPQLTMDDQAHGVTLHYNTQAFEAGANVFVGNLAQEQDVRMKGAAGTFEVTLFEKNRFGLSYLSQANTLLSVSAMAMHLRSGLDHGNSILFEVGKVDKKAKLIASDKQEYYGLFQNHIRAKRGLYILNSVEYYKNATDNSYRVRFGPSLQYFPMSRIELRVDLNNTRNFNQEISTKDRWDLMGQIHLWL